MNVLLITPLMPDPQRSGSAIRLFNIARHFARHSTLDLFVFGGGASQSAGEEIRGLARDIEYAAGCGARDARPRRARTSVGPFRIDVAIRERIRERAVPGKYDMLIAAKSITSAYLPSRNAVSVPLVVLDEGATHHLYYLREFLARFPHPVSLRSLLRWLRMLAYERGLGKRFDLIVSVSEKEARLIRRTVPGSLVHVAPNGVDTAMFCHLPGGQARGRSALFCGQYTYPPNAHAARYFAEKIAPLLEHDIRVVLAGEHPPADLLERARENPRLGVPGFVDDIRPLLASSGVFVNPMFGGGGTRLKVLHALAMACPVVSSPLGIEGIDIAAGKEVLLAGTPRDFARRIHEVLNNPDAAQQRAQAGRKVVVDRYDWQGITTRLEEQCRRLLNRCRGSV
ncbi:MAG: glycosyltransferase [Chitinivibrionales bacterium]|nr:glycosyltransferase [Chitinivibrionales bacterium]MBD3394045.1 glycosyltransferase [Chitinivibrionales bacterium]